MNTGAEVDSWFEGYDHPLKDAMLRVREVILGADARMDECVKWSTPTFTYEGNLVSFQPRAKKFVSLLFHRGSEIPGDHPRLEGDDALARIMRFTDFGDVEVHREDLEVVVRAWCDWRAVSQMSSVGPVVLDARRGCGRAHAVGADLDDLHVDPRADAAAEPGAAAGGAVDRRDFDLTGGLDRDETVYQPVSLPVLLGVLVRVGLCRQIVGQHSEAAMYQVSGLVQVLRNPLEATSLRLLRHILQLVRDPALELEGLLQLPVFLQLDGLVEGLDKALDRRVGQLGRRRCRPVDPLSLR